MSFHNSSIFNSSCVKVPLNSCSAYLPSSCSLDKSKMKKKLCKKQSSLSKERDNFHSLYNFYESIPDYKEVNQLSEEEFYVKLKILRKRQEQLTQKCFSGNYNKLDYQEDKVKTNDVPRIKNPGVKPPTVTLTTTPSTPALPTAKYDSYADDISIKSWEKSYTKKCPSALGNTPGKTVRINSSKSYTSDYKDKPMSYSFDNNDVKCTSYRTDYKLPPYDYEHPKCRNRSKSASPVRNCTVPQPFKMTQRDEDVHSYEALVTASKEILHPEENKKETTTFKANPVPITSKIPLFEQVMNDQEHRSQLAKLDSTIELQSKMKPFHFSERFERPNSRCLSRSFSSPHLSGNNNEDSSKKKFVAKPCPKGLFSNYIQHKMWEDEYFRALNKKIRAEELLKISSLPPSMAKREKVQKKARDNNRSESSCSFSTNKKLKKKRRKKNASNKKADKMEDFITTCPDPFEFQTEKRCKSRKSTKQSITPNSLESSSTSILGRQDQSPSPIYPVNRPNLAATLRTEFSRQKLKDLDKEQDFVTPKVLRVNWGVKKTQAWQNLHYDPTHDEELAMRLATRRAEQKLRQTEHDINMELMRQRVRAAPLLLEGPTNWSPRLGQPHSCVTPNHSSVSSISVAKSKYKKHSKRNNSKLSNYSTHDSKSSSKCCKNSKKKQGADVDDADSTDVELL